MTGVQKTFDVIIVGAGPAGTACALALKDSGLRVALIDKASFPRDKICGDAIPGPALEALKNLDPAYIQYFDKLVEKKEIITSRVVNPYQRELSITWKNQAFNAKRIVFDNAMYNLVKRNTSTALLENTLITEVKQDKDKVYVYTNEGTLTSNIIIGCDGAQSKIAKDLGKFSVNRKHYAGAVRGYYKNIKGTTPNLNEFFLSKRYRHGYFWLFPVNEDTCNVGFGMHSSIIARKNINLNYALNEVIAESPELAKRFEEAELVSKVNGFGLPLGTRKLPISGDGYLLCGDAASLINPLSGSGIDTAIISGIIAAEHVSENKSQNVFDAKVNKTYDLKVYKRLGPELNKGQRVWKAFNAFPGFFNLLFYLLGKKSKSSY